jgi:hypothetical protein
MLSRSETSPNRGGKGVRTRQHLGIQHWEMFRLLPQHDKANEPPGDKTTVVNY